MNPGVLSTDMTVQQVINYITQPELLITFAVLAAIGIVAAWAFGAEL